jgi:hypothetical protein
VSDHSTSSQVKSDVSMIFFMNYSTYMRGERAPLQKREARTHARTHASIWKLFFHGMLYSIATTPDDINL